jgi:DNA mismatch repair protein MutS
LRKLVEGATNRSYGIQVARLAGIPGEVINRSKKILYRIENKEQDLTDALSNKETGKTGPQHSAKKIIFSLKSCPNWIYRK